MKKLKSIVLFTLTLIISNEVIAQDYYGDADEIKQILEQSRLFSQYYVNNEPEKIAATYTSDGKIFPVKKPMIEGTAGLEKFWTTPDTRKILKHQAIASEIRIIGDYAYDHGVYKGQSQTNGGEVYSFGGNYVFVWKKVDGVWKIYLDIWN